MLERKGFKENKIIVLASLLLSATVLCGCSQAETETVTPQPETTGTVTVEKAPGTDKVRISELMSKNRSCLRDEDGDFSDWIELENYSDASVDLSGWRISDDEDEEGWEFPAVELAAGARIIVYADGKDRPGSLHTDFSISEGESLFLYDERGNLLSTAPSLSDEADSVVRLNEEGIYELSIYPTPGYPNSFEYYQQWQCSQLAAGPLRINRAAVDNRSGELQDSDWVEIKNISSETVELSDFYLSDDHNDYKLWNFPKGSLAPGKSIIVCCDEELADQSLVIAGFGLDSTNEQLYLSDAQGRLIDCVSLKNIPYDCSYGRMDGQEGWFYFYGTDPYSKPGQGYRKVSETPTALSADGVFNGVDSVSVGLQGSGKIYYTTDGSVPTEKSKLYEEPFEIGSTGIVRAVCVEEGAMPSRTLTLSYIINEEHSLPVLSLVSDDQWAFNEMYNVGRKNTELPASLSLYEEDGGFTIPCGVKMHGDTSLILPKKNMSLRFRGSYGQEELNYDIYGGGVTSFTNLVLRSGQDYYHAIIRNELCQNLCLASSDSVITQRSKYCVLYVDGEYMGIYNLMEKANEQHYANLAGVSRDSVIVEEAVFSDDSPLYQEVFSFCYENDMSLPENYEYFCSVMDVDSLIDWMILEGFCANPDLSSGNLRYCRSLENDGKWRLMFYDLDAAFFSPDNNFNNILFAYSLTARNYGKLINTLLVNEEFVDRFLNRTAQLLSTTLTNENVVAEIDRLAAQIAPEVQRDYARYGMSYEAWEGTVQNLREYFYDWNWPKHNVDTLCELLELSNEQREHYFGQLLGE